MTQREIKTPKMEKWPFFLGDGLLVGLALLFLFNSDGPLDSLGQGVCFVVVLAGAILATLPYFREFRSRSRLMEADNLATALEVVKNLNSVSDAITVSTARLESTQELSEKAVHASSEIAERMTEEANAFAEFMQKANDTEKAHLKLEVDKLKRAEGDWIQVTMHILDHTFALHKAALDSGQENVIKQLTQFRAASIDAVRRVGLIPFAPQPGEAFEAGLHQLPEIGQTGAEDAKVTGIVMCGFTFQGRRVRPAIVEVDHVIEQSDAQPDETQSAADDAEESALETNDSSPSTTR